MSIFVGHSFIRRRWVRRWRRCEQVNTQSVNGAPWAWRSPSPGRRRWSQAAEMNVVAVALIFSMPDVVPDEIQWSQFDGWTVGRVRQGIAAMAEAEGDGVTAEALLFAALEHYRVETIKLKSEADACSR